MVNYLAAKLEIYSPNVGGDKNVELARRYWPASMLAFNRLHPGDRFSDNIRGALFSGDVDWVIVPFFDLLWAAHHWPWGDPRQLRSELEPRRRQLEEDERLTVEERRYYFLVCRRSEEEGKTATAPTLDPPCGVFVGGWYENERNGTWSGVQAELAIPLKEGCIDAGTCAIRLVFHPYVPDPSRMVRVEMNMEDGRSEKRTLTTMAAVEMIVPVQRAHPAFRDGVANLSIRVPDAVSPKSLGMSEDSRVLGIFLHEIEVLTETDLRARTQH